VARVTRAAYAEAFGTVAGRPLIQLPQMAGQSESEIFFDALALNGVDVRADGDAERMLEPFSASASKKISDSDWPAICGNWISGRPATAANASA